MSPSPNGVAFLNTIWPVKTLATFSWTGLLGLMFFKINIYFGIRYCLYCTKRNFDDDNQAMKLNYFVKNQNVDKCLFRYVIESTLFFNLICQFFLLLYSSYCCTNMQVDLLALPDCSCGLDINVRYKLQQLDFTDMLIISYLLLRFLLLSRPATFQA